MRNKNLILNPYFILGLFLLIVNDAYWKYEYGNFVTGKLSDFAGLFIFPLFVAYLFPKLRKSISFITGLAFVVWKMPLATPFVDAINAWFSISIYRTIDYTDYIALLILPLSHYMINHFDFKLPLFRGKLTRSVLTYSTLIIAFCAFSATSIPHPREMPSGTVYIGKSYTIKLPKDSVIAAIRDLGYNCDYYEMDSLRPQSDDTLQYKFMRDRSYYQTDNIVRRHDYEGHPVIDDTIANIKYDLYELSPNKTKMTIINVTISENPGYQDWKQLKQASKLYNNWLKKNLIEKVK